MLPVPTSFSTQATLPQHSGAARDSPESPASPSDTTFPHPSRLLAPFHKAAKHTPATTPNPAQQGGVELAIEIEFDQLWEAAEEEELRFQTADPAMEIDGDVSVKRLREEEVLAMRKERNRCFYDDDET